MAKAFENDEELDAKIVLGRTEGGLWNAVITRTSDKRPIAPRDLRLIERALKVTWKGYVRKLRRKMKKEKQNAR